MSTVRSFLLLLPLLAGLLAACGGGGSSGSAGNQPPPQQTVTAVTLAVSVDGLPSGSAAAIRVTGPGGFAHDLAQSGTLADLLPGTYTVTAQPVVVGSGTWTPSPATQDVTLAAGANGSVAVRYAGATAVTLALSEFVQASSPTYLTAPKGDSRQFVVERAGTVRIVRNGALLAQPFLDIRTKVDTDGEGGLLSLAFDPGYAGNGRFYVYRTDAAHDIVVERYTVSGNPDVADPGSALTIIRIPHPNFVNHFGGQLAFDANNYLYIGTGDGGSSGDPNGNAQNLNSLLGKLLRLDVDAASVAEPYRIPASNPYPNQTGRRAEIWAYGLRNPWRFAFDGDRLYIADVGQAAREEVDLVSISQAGLNFGWNRMEGTICYGAGDCDRSGLTLPIFEYAHSATSSSPCSITGGFVYRGGAIPELAGRYFYSDFCAGFLRSFTVSGNAVLEQRDWKVGTIGQVVSFGQDGQGELYLLTLDGKVWKIGKAAP